MDQLGVAEVQYLASVTGIMHSVITKLEKITTCFLLTFGHYTMTLSMKQDEKKSEAISSIDIKDHQHREIHRDSSARILVWEN